MKITRTETAILRIPEDDPLADMPEEAGRLRPDRHPAHPDRQRPRGHRHHALRRRAHRHAAHAVDELGALMIGEDPLRIEAILRKLRRRRRR